MNQMKQAVQCFCVLKTMPSLKCPFYIRKYRNSHPKAHLSAVALLIPIPYLPAGNSATLMYTVKATVREQDVNTFYFPGFWNNVIVVPSSHRTQEGSWAFCSYVCQPIRVTALCCPQHAWVHPHTHLIPKGHVCCSQLRLLCSYFSGERPPTENTPLAMEAKGVADHRGLQKAHALLGLLCSTNGDHVQENSFAILLCYYNENTKSIHCSFTFRPNSNSKVSSQ